MKTHFAAVWAYVDKLHAKTKNLLYLTLTLAEEADLIQH